MGAVEALFERGGKVSRVARRAAGWQEMDHKAAMPKEVVDALFEQGLMGIEERRVGELRSSVREETLGWGCSG